MAKVDLPGVSTFRDRHGKARYRYRHKGHATYLPGEPGSPLFLAAYDRAKRGEKVLGVREDRVDPATIAGLIVRYYRSADFDGLKPVTRSNYRKSLEPFRARFGDLPTATLRPEHVQRIIDGMRATPAAANNLHKRLRTLMAFGLREGLITRDPTAGTRKLRLQSEGHIAWSAADIDAFRARFEPGSKERLALALLLYTGQRSGDVARMGRQHVQGDALAVRQQKTGAALVLPIHPELRAELAAAPADNLAFLVTEYGKPFSVKGFQQWFGAAARQAGLTRRTAHGLRKAAAAMLAEAGCSEFEIAAITGHASLKELQRYTKGARQELLARAAMGRLERTYTEQTLANPSEKLDQNARKSLKTQGNV